LQSLKTEEVRLNLDVIEWRIGHVRHGSNSFAIILCLGLGFSIDAFPPLVARHREHSKLPLSNSRTTPMRSIEYLLCRITSFSSETSPTKSENNGSAHQITVLGTAISLNGPLKRCHPTMRCLSTQCTVSRIGVVEGLAQIPHLALRSLT